MEWYRRRRFLTKNTIKIWLAESAGIGVCVNVPLCSHLPWAGRVLGHLHGRAARAIHARLFFFYPIAGLLIMEIGMHERAILVEQETLHHYHIITECHISARCTCVVSTLLVRSHREPRIQSVESVE